MAKHIGYVIIKRQPGSGYYVADSDVNASLADIILRDGLDAFGRINPAECPLQKRATVREYRGWWRPRRAYKCVALVRVDWDGPSLVYCVGVYR